jgi:hypothetical protein
VNDKLNAAGFYTAAFNEKSQGSLDFTTKQMTLQNANGLIADLTVADAGEMIAANGGDAAMVPDKTLAFDLSAQIPGTSRIEMSASGAATYDRNSGVWTYDSDPANPKQSCVLKFSRAANNALSMTIETPEACAEGAMLTADKYNPITTPVISPAVPKR